MKMTHPTILAAGVAFALAVPALAQQQSRQPPDPRGAWSAATKASRIDSLVSATSAGSQLDGITRPSGIGSSHATSGSWSPSGPSALPGGVRSMGLARRCREPSMSKQTLVAMRYSHERRAARPSQESIDRHALTIASCAASSASNDEPSIR